MDVLPVEFFLHHFLQIGPEYGSTKPSRWVEDKKPLCLSFFKHDPDRIGFFFGGDWDRFVGAEFRNPQFFDPILFCPGTNVLAETLHFGRVAVDPGEREGRKPDNIVACKIDIGIAAIAPHMFEQGPFPQHLT